MTKTFGMKEISRKKNRVVQGDRVIEGRVIEGDYCSTFFQNTSINCPIVKSLKKLKRLLQLTKSSVKCQNSYQERQGHSHQGTFVILLMSFSLPLLGNELLNYPCTQTSGILIDNNIILTSYSARCMTPEYGDYNIWKQNAENHHLMPSSNGATRPCRIFQL